VVRQFDIDMWVELAQLPRERTASVGLERSAARSMSGVSTPTSGPPVRQIGRARSGSVASQLVRTEPVQGCEYLVRPAFDQVTYNCIAGHVHRMDEPVDDQHSLGI